MKYAQDSWVYHGIYRPATKSNWNSLQPESNLDGLKKWKVIIYQKALANIITAGSCHHLDTSMKLLNKCVNFCSSCDMFRMTCHMIHKIYVHVSCSAWSSTANVAVQHQCSPIHSILLAVQYVLCSSHPHQEHEPGLRGWLTGRHISAHAEQCRLACPAPVTHTSVRIDM